MSWVTGFQLQELKESHMDFSWIKKKMHSTIASHHGNKIAKYSIVKV